MTDCNDQQYEKSYIKKTVNGIPSVSTVLSPEDKMNKWKVRLGINRMNYRVKPGLYAAGNPGSDSPVLVTANYKLTFDMLRKELTGIDAWILVLDTDGINVWCAAGKGAFGTDELIYRIRDVKLKKIVNHSTIILPQLGAPGVSAHKVKKESGFYVKYGPVRAEDIPRYINDDFKTSGNMRRVRFNFSDRIILSLLEYKRTFWPQIIIFILLSGIYYFQHSSISLRIFINFIPFAGAFAVGSIVVPALLPWIPGRSFALKGWIAGMVWAVIINSTLNTFTGNLVNILLLPPISAFLALNFTGSTTFTSLSGVVKEMKYSIPLIILSLVSGLIILII